MKKSVKIERKDLFPEHMKIEMIKIGKGVLWGESTTGFVGKSIAHVLSHVYNQDGNWSTATAEHLDFTIRNKIEKELKFVIPEDYIREIIKNESEKILKKVYKRGFYIFEFEIEDLPVHGEKKEKVKVRITALDVPRFPKSIKKVTVDGTEKYIGKNEERYNTLDSALGSFWRREYLPKLIAKIINQKEARLMDVVQWKKILETLGLDKDSYYLWDDLALKVWNGLELEFEISEEEIFPAL